MKLNKVLVSLLLAASSFTVFSCDSSTDDTPETPVEVSQFTTLEGEITANKTLTKDKKWLLKGNVFVQSGVTLTIEPGTVIFGDKKTKGALVINRGAKIMAKGTAAEPIIFTSAEAPGLRDRGDWAGVVLLGKATHNRGGEPIIEGITGGTNPENGKYGGTADNDNSGVMEFVRIEFAGVALSPDNELNSLTFGGVGNATKVDNIVVSYAGDDAYEWFGGTSNHKYLAAYNTLDDDFDTDSGFRGKIQFGYVLRDYRAADISGSRAFEASSSKTAGTMPASAPVFANITAVGPAHMVSKDWNANFKHGMRANEDSRQELHNSIVIGFPTALENDKGTGVYAGNLLLKNVADGTVNTNGEARTSVAGVFATDDFGIFTSSKNTVDVLPVLKSDFTFAGTLTDMSTKGMTKADYVGAFGKTVDAGWNHTAKWFKLNPQDVDYGVKY